MGSLWDEFSEFLPENRVPTSAEFNTYPIRIFNIYLCKDYSGEILVMEK